MTVRRFRRVWFLVVLLIPGAAYSQETLWEVFNTKAKEAYERNAYDEAARLYEEAMKAAEAIGPDDPRLASACNNLAEVFRLQKKYADAERLYRRALVIREKTLGKEHEDVALIINNLAVLYGDQGRYEYAELMYLRAIQIAEAKLKDHPQVATIHHNVAELYRVQKKYADAERHYTEALRIQMLANDPEAAKTFLALVTIDEHGGDRATLIERWRQISLLAPKAGRSLELAAACKELGWLTRNRREALDEASLNLIDDYWQRTLADLETALGPKHQDVSEVRQVRDEHLQWRLNKLESVEQRPPAEQIEPETTPPFAP